MDVKLNCTTCGHSTPVRFTDAGKVLPCTSCQQMIDVPRLSELRQLSGIQEVPFVLEPLSPKQIRGRRLLKIICSIMTLLLFIDMLVTFHITTELKSSIDPTQQHLLSYIDKQAIVQLISFVVFAFFACAGHLWARVLLVIKFVFGTVLVICWADISGNNFFYFDAAILAGMVIALLTIKT